jgi:hypothetical protein
MCYSGSIQWSSQRPCCIEYWHPAYQTGAGYKSLSPRELQDLVGRWRHCRVPLYGHCPNTGKVKFVLGSFAKHLLISVPRHR